MPSPKSKTNRVQTFQHFDERVFAAGSASQRLVAAVAFQERARRDHFGVYPIAVGPTQVRVNLAEWPEGRAFSPGLVRLLRRVVGTIVD